MARLQPTPGIASGGDWRYFWTQSTPKIDADTNSAYDLSAVMTESASGTLACQGTSQRQPKRPLGLGALRSDLPARAASTATALTFNYTITAADPANTTISVLEHAIEGSISADVYNPVHIEQASLRVKPSS